MGEARINQNIEEIIETYHNKFLDKRFKDCIGLVVEGGSGGFNVLMLKDRRKEQLFINHEKDLDQLWLNENYDLVATSDSVEVNIEYLK